MVTSCPLLSIALYYVDRSYTTAYQYSAITATFLSKSSKKCDNKKMQCLLFSIVGFTRNSQKCLSLSIHLSVCDFLKFKVKSLASATGCSMASHYSHRNAITAIGIGIAVTFIVSVVSQQKIKCPDGESKLKVKFDRYVYVAYIVISILKIMFCLK